MMSAPYVASLLGYDSGGLWVRALLAVPDRPRPRGGFPLLVACHGFHPDPPRYGFDAAGHNARPGDYYRSVPRWYTDAGFVVAMPDYRGHNDSGGHADPADPQATLGYAGDVRAMFAALDLVPEADPRRVFLWGHSLGAEVALRVLATPPGEPRALQVLGASLWSIAGRLPPLVAVDAPVLLQHAAADPVAPSALSTTLADRLRALGRLRGLELPPGEAHFFAGAQAAEAVRRDLEFFSECMNLEART
jgi:dienelactone hydrolase